MLQPETPIKMNVSNTGRKGEADRVANMVRRGKSVQKRRVMPGGEPKGGKKGKVDYLVPALKGEKCRKDTTALVKT